MKKGENIRNMLSLMAKMVRIKEKANMVARISKVISNTYVKGKFSEGAESLNPFSVKKITSSALGAH